MSQLSQHQLQNMMAEQTQNMIASVNEIIRNATAAAPLQGNVNTPNARNNNANNNDPNDNLTWSFFDWNEGKGRIHAVPLNYRLPSVPTHMMFQTWHLGHQQENIRPFKAINPSLDFPSNYGKSLYCHLKYVMNAITDKGLHLLNLRPNTVIGSNNCDEVFLKGFLPYLQDVYGTQPKRPLEITPVTIYNKKFKKTGDLRNEDLNDID